MKSMPTPTEQNSDTRQGDGRLTQPVRPRGRSPLEIMIDKACGYEQPKEPEPRRIANQDEKDDASAVASEVIRHIDEMYPGMWEGVPKTARLSVRNTIINRVTALLIRRANENNSATEARPS